MRDLRGKFLKVTEDSAHFGKKTYYVPFGLWMPGLAELFVRLNGLSRVSLDYDDEVYTYELVDEEEDESEQRAETN